ncbi:hypothetical protein LTR62_002233 [Meristemomyces frigidus]|uniref:Tim44-like domain-containing protein n=1 Tax=Meristemomyces frigidus TaxID=1508187 RepID=A0AAN7YHS5_9PEZI|nr:hypothetical protein LTR62_002233 [Meristemomyces frigidus]
MGRAINPQGSGRQSAPSMTVQMKKMKNQALKSGQIPHDMGLLPDTFVMPRGTQLPSWFTDFSNRWLLEKKRLRTRALEFFSAFVYRWFLVKPRPRLQLGRIPGIAQELHREMYTAFAQGGLAAMESKICEGLLGSLKRRVAQRESNTRLKWTVHKYLSPPRRMSYKAAAFPAQAGAGEQGTNGLVQAVVRIHSVQSLRHIKTVSTRLRDGRVESREVVVDSSGREVGVLREVEAREDEGVVPATAKETVEYFVVQKSLRNGKEGQWMVWGTTEAMTVERARREAESNGRKVLKAVE